jgi:2'-5' RNA ligase
MRLFTALDLPADVLLRLERLLAALRPEAMIKWSPLDNLHVTTKFIGEWPEHRVDELDAVLDKLRCAKPIDVELRDLGWFPNAHAPRVLWAGVYGGDALPALAVRTDEALAGLGIAKEKHPFAPHLTLARIKNAVPLQRLRAKVEEFQTAPIGHFRAPGFYLFRSDPGSNASIYRKLRGYEFGSEIGKAANQQS